MGVSTVPHSSTGAGDLGFMWRRTPSGTTRGPPLGPVSLRRRPSAAAQQSPIHRGVRTHSFHPLGVRACVCVCVCAPVSVCVSVLDRSQCTLAAGERDCSNKNRETQPPNSAALVFSIWWLGAGRDQTGLLGCDEVIILFGYLVD